MSRARAPLAALCALIVLVALIAQLAGDGLYGALAVAPSLPRALAGDWPFALAANTGLDRLPFVRLELARGALVRAEPARALTLIAPLRPSPAVIDVRGRAELLAGDPAAALRDFLAAGDFIAAQSAIDPIAARDPHAAYGLVRDFERQLETSTAAPEILAEVEWREGVIASAAAMPYEALDAFARALGRAPNDEKYLLNDAFAALRIGDAEGARRTYERAAQVVPDSLDAFVGVAVTKAVLGDCAGSRTAFARAKTLALAQDRSAAPERAGYASDVLAPFARCNS